jgi:hypothetical protein
MAFMPRAVGRGVAAVGVALVMAMMPATQAVANTEGKAQVDAERTSAMSAQSVGIAGVILKTTPVPADGRVSCYGYYGTFKVGSDVIVVDWATTSNNECFGIATDRTIWHAWQGSGGWKRMPGNGHADDTWGIAENSGTGERVIIVEIPGAPRPYWCQNYTPATNWTGIWYAC